MEGREKDVGSGGRQKPEQDSPGFATFTTRSKLEHLPDQEDAGAPAQGAEQKQRQAELRIAPALVREHNPRW